MQDLAVMLYANCDATYEVRKYLDRHIRTLSDFRNPNSATPIMNSVLRLVSSFNDGMLSPVLTELREEVDRYMNIMNTLSKLAEKDLTMLNKQDDEENDHPSGQALVELDVIENDDVDE